MVSAGSRPGDRHKHPPIAYRPPSGTDDRAWLLQHAVATDSSVNAVITRALRELRERAGGGQPAELGRPGS